MCMCVYGGGGALPGSASPFDGVVPSASQEGCRRGLLPERERARERERERESESERELYVLPVYVSLR